MRALRTAIIAGLAFVLGAGPAAANNSGIFGYAGAPDTNGGLICTFCHTGGVAPFAALSGPAQVAGGSTHTYTMTITGGQEIACGLDVRALSGALIATEPGTKLWNGEITHTAPRPVDPSGDCSFSFDWVAPLETGVAAIYGAGNSVNLDATTGGDSGWPTGIGIFVTGPPPGMIPPVADANGPHTTVLGNSIQFDGTASSDSDGVIVAYDWDFGDTNTGTGPTPLHTYAAAGEHVVTLTVTDNHANTAQDQTTARVLAQPGTIAAVRITNQLGDRASYVTAPLGDPRLFVVKQLDEATDIGSILIVENGTILPQPFLEIPGMAPFGLERGLQAIAFAPDYATSGLFYVLYTDTVGTQVIARYKVSSNPNLADVSSAEVILSIPDPQGINTHRGATIRFGPDGYLYLATGDGGAGSQSQGDQHLHGKMLRLDVSGGLGSGYSIPPSNPHAGPGLPLDEIWAKGFRNPFRFDFDSLTGDLYIADVGVAMLEEINVEPAGSFGGANYGWDVMEGSLCTDQSSDCNIGILTEPEFEYPHGPACSIIGGSVYRGWIPELEGRYFFADFCTAEIWSISWTAGSGAGGLIDHTTELTPNVGTLDSITAISRGGFGEMYMVNFFTGELFRIVSPGLECLDGVDNDGDGRTDFPDDPGCKHPGWNESPACDDDLDNDGDGRADWDGGGGALPDPHCVGKPWRRTEAFWLCGVGAELALVLPPLSWLMGRRRRSRARSPKPGYSA